MPFFAGSGFGSREKFWIHADPDTQHWNNLTRFTAQSVPTELLISGRLRQWKDQFEFALFLASAKFHPKKGIGSATLLLMQIFSRAGIRIQTKFNGLLDQQKSDA